MDGGEPGGATLVDVKRISPEPDNSAPSADVVPPETSQVETRYSNAPINVSPHPPSRGRRGKAVT